MRVLVFAALIALGACKPKEEPKPQPIVPKIGDDSIPRKQPVDPNAPMHLNAPDLARVQLDLIAARAAIREYKMLNAEKNPPDLAALQLKLSFPADLTYDSNSGMVKSRTYPQY
jgi:hypothetical protein